MEAKEFKGNYFSLKNRLIKHILPSGIVFITFVILIASKSTSTENKILALAVISVLIIASSLSTFLMCINFINTVIMDDSKITFIKYNYGNKISEQFNVNEVDVSIESTKKRHNNDYYLKFKTKEGNYIVNGLQNWDYNTVVSLYRNFKSTKNEKVIFDDEYWLDIMEMKANGMTTRQAIMSKTKRRLS